MTATDTNTHRVPSGRGPHLRAGPGARPAPGTSAPGSTRRPGADPIAFWEDAARRLDWAEPWHTALEWGRRRPTPRPGAVRPRRALVRRRALERRRELRGPPCRGRPRREVALFFEGEPGDRETVTYADLQARVSRAANALTDLGIGPGDRVVVYPAGARRDRRHRARPARIGAVHSSSSAASAPRRFSPPGHPREAAGHLRRPVPPREGRRGGESPPTKAPATCPTSSTSSSCAAQARTWPGPRAATCGGTGVDRASEEHARALRRAPAVHSSLPPAPPGGEGAWSTLRAAISPAPGRTGRTSTRRIPTSTGAPRTSPGSPRTPTRSTARSATASPRSSTRAPRRAAPRTAPRDHRALRRDRLLHGADPDPHLMSWFGGRHHGRPRPVHAAPARHRRRGDQPRAWIWFHRTFGRGELPIIDTWWQSRRARRCSCPCPG